MNNLTLIKAVTFSALFDLLNLWIGFRVFCTFSATVFLTLLVTAHTRCVFALENEESADIVSTGEIRQLRERVVESLTAHHSGEFQGTWKERKESPVPAKAYEFSSNFRGLFDEAADCYSVKRGVWSHDRSGSQMKMADYGVVFTPDLTLRFGEVGLMVVMTNGGDRGMGTATIPPGTYVDPRRFGGTFSGVVLGATLNVQDINNMFQGDPISVKRDGDDRLRFQWENVNQQRTLMVELKGVVALPMELIWKERYPDVDNNAWSPPLETRKIGWEEAGGVFVPVSIFQERRRAVLLDPSRIPSTPEERRYEVTTVEIMLNWTRVNESIPLSEFSLEWLQVPEGTAIVDQRVPSEPKTTFIGDKRVGRVPGFTPEPEGREAAIAPPKMPLWKSPLIWINAIAFAVIGTVFFLRRRRHSNPAQLENNSGS